MEKVVIEITKDAEIILKNAIQKNCESIFNFFMEWRTTNDKSSEKDAIAQCMLQMILTNSKSILSLSEGIQLVPTKGKKTVDPTSIIPILRSMYERTFIFHNIFVQPENETESNILLYLWQIRGLNNRQNLPFTPEEFEHKKEKEQVQIERLRSRIRGLLTELNITDLAKDKIDKIARSNSSNIYGYKYIKDEEGIILGMERISFSDSPKVLFGTDELYPLYTLLSFHSHPSYLGTLQFGQMFNNGYDTSMLIIILTNVIILQNFFIDDFCRVAKGAKEIWIEKGYNLLGANSNFKNS